MFRRTALHAGFLQTLANQMDGWQIGGTLLLFSVSPAHAGLWYDLLQGEERMARS